jgi:RecB family exonuclease
MPPTGDRPTPSNLFSFSRVKTFFQCPKRYRFRYLKGRKEAFRSIESYLGSTVHEVLEWLYQERDQGREPALPSLLERLASCWGHGWQDDIVVVRMGESADDYLGLGREMLGRYHDHVLPRDRSTTVALEQRLSLRLDNGLVFTGFADRVGRTEAGRLFVVDYKSSRSLGDPSDFSEGLQAPMYATCLLERHAEAKALAGYHYLRHGTTSWQTVNAERARQLKIRFSELAEETRVASEFPARPGILCAWCGFNHICDEARVPDDLAGGLRLALSRQS